MSSKFSGLGKGLESLIPTNLVAGEFDVVTPPSFKGDGESVQEVAVSKVDPNPDQPRQHFSISALDELAVSIKAHGVMQPIIVIAGKADRYQIVAGERRLRAVKSLNLETIPAIVRSYDDQTNLELALIENLQREELNPIETATAYQKLMDQFNMTSKKISGRVGKADTTVKNIVRLLGLPLEVKRAVAAGEISEGHARSILSLKDEPLQLEMLALIKKHGWTVRQAEQYAKEFSGTKPDEVVATKVTAANENKLTKNLEKRLGAQVRIQPMSKGGRLTIRYQDDEELERISKAFS